MNEASVDLSIVIVAWNVRDLVLDCLASIADAKRTSPENNCQTCSALTMGKLRMVRS